MLRVGTGVTGSAAGGGGWSDRRQRGDVPRSSALVVSVDSASGGSTGLGVPTSARGPEGFMLGPSADELQLAVEARDTVMLALDAGMSDSRLRNGEVGDRGAC